MEIKVVKIAQAKFRKALFRYSRIHINAYVLKWIGVELELNSDSIHPNACEVNPTISKQCLKWNAAQSHGYTYTFATRKVVI